MNFVFTEKKMTSSDDLRAYAEKKIGKLEKLFRGESTAYVTFRVERNRNIAEVTVNANGMFYRASESTNDMYVSIDATVASLTRQVRKYKTRLEKRIHENGKRRTQKNRQCISPPLDVHEQNENEKYIPVISTANEYTTNSFYFLSVSHH